jgi:dTMP kinase
MTQRRDRRGAFIVVEGPDGAGKTTLAGILGERVRGLGLEVVAVREPGGTPLAEAARRVVLDRTLAVSPLAELFLILAARTDLVDGVIRPALAAGRVVVSDRYELSTEAYQVAGRQLPRRSVLAANRLATGGLKPDLTLVLDVPAQVGLARLAASGRGRDRIEGAEGAVHERVSQAFAAVRGRGIVHLDATHSADLVARRGWDMVRRLLGKLFPDSRV